MQTAKASILCVFLPLQAAAPLLSCGTQIALYVGAAEKVENRNKRRKKMKKQTLASFGLSLVFMIAAIFAAAVHARANNDYGTRITYQVPFDFYVGNDKMPAGKYEFHRVSESAYQIRNAENSKSVFVHANQLTGDENRVKTAKLVFNRYGKNNFLRIIYTQARTGGRLVNESKTERRVIKDSESDSNLAKVKPTIVEIEAQ